MVRRVIPLVAVYAVPSLAGDQNLYSLNPIFTAGYGKAGLAPQYKQYLGMKGKYVHNYVHNRCLGESLVAIRCVVWLEFRKL